MVSETTAMVLAEGHKHTMALDQSALLEVLDALKAAADSGRIRTLGSRPLAPYISTLCALTTRRTTRK